MTQKQTKRSTAPGITGVPPWEARGEAPGPAPGLWRRLLNRMRSWMQVPYGYEDETGFHYGAAPTPEWAKKRNSTALPVLTDRAANVIRYPDACAPEATIATDKVIAPPDSVSAA